MRDHTKTPVTLDVLDADGYDDMTAYLTGFDAVDEMDALREARAEGLV